MKLIQSTVAGLVMAGSALALGGVAQASSMFYISVAGEDVKPGQEITIGAGCYQNHMEDLHFSSPLFEGELQVVGWDNVTVLTGHATVPADAKAGSYPISFTCDGKKVPGTFTVTTPKQAAPKKETVAKQVPKKEAPKQATTPVTKAEAPQPEVAAKPAAKPVEQAPAGAAQTGGHDDPADYTAAFAVTGASILAAGGAGFVFYRRRLAKK
ncbi:hypothetical protein SAMN05421504_106463 [Amycolatopsis xylanica]|uniref:LPXTG-motif cell wall anchor domain-containing protein n=1 Tax=Amycolatopsis xylanica TaxID=589385 RepID=A0A1H3M468_9PSEU|nr:hypothetical protein [Amycolatopsis xylanica]SDY70815.1 hypothetical protein SAMN05421504_106463 [Amycolatopsis xylanica]